MRGSGWCSGQVLFAGGLGGGGRRPAPPPRGGADRRGHLPRPGARRRRPGAVRQGRDDAGERPAAATLASGRSSTTRPPGVRVGTETGPGPHLRRGHRPSRAGGVADRCPRGASPSPATGSSRSAASKPPPVHSEPWLVRPVRRRRRGRAARPTARAAVTGEAWERVLADHRGITGGLHTDAGWARAAADYAAAHDRPGPAGHPHRRHHPGGRSRAQAAAQLARVAAGATEGRVTAFAVGHRVRGGRHRGGRQPSSSPTCSATPRPPPWPVRSWSVGAGWLGLRSHPRPVGSVTYGGPGRPRVARRRPPRDRRRHRLRTATGGPMTDRPDPRRRRPRAHLGPGPHRLVPVPAHPPEQGTGDPARMYRRFDVDHLPGRVRPGGTSRSSSTWPPPPGRHSIDETLELDRAAAEGGPDAIIGGLPPTESVAEAIALLDRQMAAPASAGSAPWAASTCRSPRPAVLRALEERDLVFELMTPSRPARRRGSGPGRLRAT